MSAHSSPVSRDDVADGVGLPRRTAAFHLDRLAELGLLTVTFARRSGRSGPGAGRPAKLYQRSSAEVSVSLPQRQYDLAGNLLAGAIEQAQQSGQPPGQVLAQQARDLGRAMARAQTGRSEHTGQLEPGRGEYSALMSLLETHGFEPQIKGGDVLLHNCPFHALAQEHTSLICGMNLQLVEGVLEGLGQTGLYAYLDPAPPRCCVRMGTSDQK